ncbi:DUF2929 family protein [Aquibacillus salsiterrae]|uniref:YjzD family protein n=1 Tax=Aquibacillus salsiterrae TaxID=2950439 RepID=A0A9X4AGK7_9BACI|nr:DUF2929 family protein [Aquibacillus salsiterrae]MDC3417218.1 YjzD family protein [Aquibacillus salsiterrae]
MRYIWTIIWAILLSFLVSYVLTAMAGETFQFGPVFAVAAMFIIAITTIGDGVLKEEQE